MRDAKVLLITNQQMSGPRLIDTLAAALPEFPPGSAAVLLREKQLEARPLLELARAIRALTRPYGARLHVSSRIDVALAAGADGVQLGHDAPAFSEARALAPDFLKLGVSLHANEHGPEEADWVLLSPVFPTASKPGARTLGLEGLRAGCEQNASLPVFALGGIDERNAAACLEAGAAGVAVMSAVLGDSRPAEAARRLARAFTR